MSRPARIYSANRRSLLAKIHLLAKQSGMEDEDYRDLLDRETGRRSAAALSEPQLVHVCELLAKTGAVKQVKAEGMYAPKLRALWISAYHLGVARSRSDAALIAFVKRQCRIDHTRFLVDAADANKAIEGLKAWLAREADVRWTDWPTHPRRAVADAQVRLLDGVGNIRAIPGTTPETFLEDYACRVTGKRRGIQCLDNQDWDRAIAALGARVRRVLNNSHAESHD